MSQSKKVKVRRGNRRESPLLRTGVPETKITYRQELQTAPASAGGTALTPEELSLAFERDARRYAGAWEVTL